MLGIAARNGIMLISHYRHLEDEEGEPFGPDLVLRGAQERLAPILMTALATGLALVPLVIGGNKPGTRSSTRWRSSSSAAWSRSTLLNLFVVPSLYLFLGKSRKERRELGITAGEV